jgi:hypothetical protein
MNPFYPILNIARQIESITGVRTTTPGLSGMVIDKVDWSSLRSDVSKPAVAAWHQRVPGTVVPPSMHFGSV